MVAKLYGDGVAAYFEQSLLYYQHPHPLFNVGRANKATWGLLLAAKLPIFPITPAFRFSLLCSKWIGRNTSPQGCKEWCYSKGTNNMTKIAVDTGILSGALVAYKFFTSPTMR